MLRLVKRNQKNAEGAYIQQDGIIFVSSYIIRPITKRAFDRDFTLCRPEFQLSIEC